MKVENKNKECSTNFIILNPDEEYTVPSEKRYKSTDAFIKEYTSYKNTDGALWSAGKGMSNVLWMLLSLTIIGMFITFILSLNTDHLMLEILIPLIIIAIILAVASQILNITLLMTTKTAIPEDVPHIEIQEVHNHKAGGPKTCPECNGTGRCKYCMGTGKRGWTGRVATSPSNCMQCLGWGVCQTCHGKGIV